MTKKTSEPERPLVLIFITLSYSFFGALVVVWGIWTLARASLHYFGEGVTEDILLTTRLPPPFSSGGVEVLPVAWLFLGAGLAGALGAVGLYGLSSWGWWLIQEATTSLRLRDRGSSL